MKTILGRKVGMTQVFTEDGEMIPVTVVEAGPVEVIQLKTKENDGYDAVQVGFEDLKESRANKPTKGHFEKWNAPLKRVLAEIRVDEGESYEAGQTITVADFEEGKRLDVTGTSKGKGTQGNIKRHGHHRGPTTHGSKHKRMVGALAGAAYPGRVFKGNKGPGRMGRDTITVQNVELIKVFPERNVMLIKGALPGKKGGLLTIHYAIKGQGKDDTPVNLQVYEVEIPVEETVQEDKAPKSKEDMSKKDAPVEEAKDEAVEVAEDAKEDAPAEEEKTEAPVEEAKDEKKEEAPEEEKAEDKKDDSEKEDKKEDNADDAKDKE